VPFFGSDFSVKLLNAEICQRGGEEHVAKVDL
jgi:hypothetical protein